MKRFFHPFLKNETVTTSEGKLVLDKNGSAEVEDDIFELLMKIPCNAEHQAKLDAQKEPAQKPEEKQEEKQEEKKDELKEEDLQLLELPDLKAIAKHHKIQFAKNVTKPELIISIMAAPPQEPPPPPILP
jgi:hypothetical protein